MGYGYQKRDAEIIDYQLYQLDGIHLPLRGPKPSSLEKGSYFTCVGAAQTFGCYCEEPYPRLIGDELGIETINFGAAGVGPSFFVGRQGIIDYINNGLFTIVQVLSGRSVSNHLYESNGREMLTRKSDGTKQGAEPMYRDLIESKDYREINKVLHDTRRNWVSETITLLQSIKVPKILLWFSIREPEYSAEMNRVRDFFGSFPQLVNLEMVELLKPYVSGYVECVSSEGLPQKLFSRYDGQPVSVNKREDLGGGQRSINAYYPSPQMHRLAADLLIPESKKLIS